MKTGVMMTVSMLALVVAAATARAGEPEKRWAHSIEVFVDPASNYKEIKVVGTVSDPDVTKVPVPIDKLIPKGTTVLLSDGKTCHAENAPTYDLMVSIMDADKQEAKHHFDSAKAVGGMLKGDAVIDGARGEVAARIDGKDSTARVMIRTTACRFMFKKWMVAQVVNPSEGVVALKVGKGGTLVELPACQVPAGKAGTFCRDVVALGYELQMVDDPSTLSEALVGKLQGVAEAVKAGRFGDARRLARAARVEVPR